MSFICQIVVEMEKTWKQAIQRRQRYYNVSVCTPVEDYMLSNLDMTVEKGGVQFGTLRNILIPVTY